MHHQLIFMYLCLSRFTRWVQSFIVTCTGTVLVDILFCHNNLPACLFDLLDSFIHVYIMYIYVHICMTLYLFLHEYVCVYCVIFYFMISIDVIALCFTHIIYLCNGSCGNSVIFPHLVGFHFLDKI